ncbi:MAG: hypothetical protein H7270_06140 [Dermatophilaceae bacterium]|nr:hypothetical protein [Dermatophilaceae bacterium]
MRGVDTGSTLSGAGAGGGRRATGAWALVVAILPIFLQFAYVTFWAALAVTVIRRASGAARLSDAGQRVTGDGRRRTETDGD